MVWLFVQNGNEKTSSGLLKPLMFFWMFLILRPSITSGTCTYLVPLNNPFVDYCGTVSTSPHARFHKYVQIPKAFFILSGMNTVSHWKPLDIPYNSQKWKTVASLKCKAPFLIDKFLFRGILEKSGTLQVSENASASSCLVRKDGWRGLSHRWLAEGYSQDSYARLLAAGHPFRVNSFLGFHLGAKVL